MGHAEFLHDSLQQNALFGTYIAKLVRKSSSLIQFYNDFITCSTQHECPGVLREQQKMTSEERKLRINLGKRVVKEQVALASATEMR